ncbi:MAG: FAD-dependent oxidoreductase [Chitinophagaceae bacterium]|nr:FAD-dependent oxidoreductase [Rubrivivax sp.]
MRPPRIAVIGAGVAGAACAAGLLLAGVDVTVFDKSRGVGGRLATRRAEWTDVDGTLRTAEFDHGCPHFTVSRPRFQAVIDRAEARGVVARWRQRVSARFPAGGWRHGVVPTSNMPAFCRHLLSGVPLRLGQAVTSLQRAADGWRLLLSDGRAEGPFDQVMLAIPAPQATTLLAGHENDWAASLASAPMTPCWTLMAVTDEPDWPWDMAEIERGALAVVVRNDRKPARQAPPGLAHWVAHATPTWSCAHLEDEPAQVTELLRAALEKLLPGTESLRWHHSGVHRWRYARLTQPAPEGIDCWWNAGLGLGVCGDAFGDGSVEAAWCSGDELADAIAAVLDVAPDHDPAFDPSPALADPVH